MNEIWVNPGIYRKLFIQETVEINFRAYTEYKVSIGSLFDTRIMKLAFAKSYFY